MAEKTLQYNQKNVTTTKTHGSNGEDEKSVKYANFGYKIKKLLNLTKKICISERFILSLRKIYKITIMFQILSKLTNHNNKKRAKMKTETLSHFSQDGYKLNLVRESNLIKKKNYPDTLSIKYRVTLNRKSQGTSISEYTMRKLFASICQNIVLQLKIY